MLDTIFKNGAVYDGTGGEPANLDVGVSGGEIVALGNLKEKMARRVIDVSGQAVCPGFIDIQNHSDSYWTIFDYPHQQSLLAQGITSVNFGNCGASLAPLPSLEALKSVQKWHSLEGANLNWQYFDQYLYALSKQPLGVNVGSLVGHATLRRGLVGDAVRKITAQESKVLERLLEGALRSGGAGLSLGLIYAHEYNAGEEELLRLSRTVKKFDRLLSVHLRSEGTHVLEALDEALHLAESAGARLKISHLKIRGENNWPLFDQLLSRIERAFSRGLKIYFDIYPYDTSWNVLYTYLPKWGFEGGRKALLGRLAQPYLRRKILDSLSSQAEVLKNIVIATAGASPHLVGRTFSDIAAAHGVSVPEAVLQVLSSAESEVVVFDKNVDERQMRELLKHPLSVVATDGAGFDQHLKSTFKNLVHPRCFGAAVRFLEMATKENLLPLSQAVHKLTGRPAEALNLPRRGIIKKRAHADIVVFDPDKLSDRATLENPFLAPAGISSVMVNGKLAIEAGRFTGKYAGEVLRY
ncbi:MAG: amidohydrolase family protein [Patescibacteria group bacterium]|nr:amidohydrolase family protein [Patescibacteria group bacterium]